MEERDRTEGQESVEATMLSVLLKKLREVKEEKDYQAMKDITLKAAHLYEQIGVLDRAVHYYLTALYYDVSGVEYNHELELYMAGKHGRQRSESAFYGICIRPQVMQGIVRLQEQLDNAEVHRLYEQEKLPICLCPEEKLLEIIEELKKDAYDYMTWRSYFRKNYIATLREAEEKKKSK